MTNYDPQVLKNLTLGKTTTYPKTYDPTLLQPVARQLNRQQLGIVEVQPFTQGSDIWTLYELSWLNSKGVPQVAIGEVEIDFRSLNLIESKSFKLYLNSFNQTKFKNIDDVTQTIQRDLTQCVQGDVKVRLNPLHFYQGQQISTLSGQLLDNQDIEIENYQFDPHLLEDCTSSEIVNECLVSHLLKSNCLITQQPDWGSVQIHYHGKAINREKLLRYLISFRQHNEFHEQCVERIFCDLLKYAKPTKLTVYARYTRRGGLDINPFRSNFETIPANLRLARQ